MKTKLTLILASVILLVVSSNIFAEGLGPENAPPARPGIGAREDNAPPPVPAVRARQGRRLQQQARTGTHLEVPNGNHGQSTLHIRA